MTAKLTRTPHELTVRFIPVKHGDVVDLGSTGLPGITGRHNFMGFKPGPGAKATGWIVVLVDESAPAATKPVKRSTTNGAPRSIRRVVPPEPVDEKTRLVREIRSFLPFIEAEHPDLAAEIRRGMDAVEKAS